MKTTILLFLILVATLPLHGQPGTVLTIEKNMLSQNNPDIDTLAGIKDKLIRFRFDTLFFINQLALTDYLACKKNYATLYNSTGSLSDSIQLSMEGIKSSFEMLSNTIDGNNQLFRESIEENVHRLDTLLASNNQLTEKNVQLNTDLEKLRNEIKSEVWKSMGKKLVFGVGGIVVGIGLTTLVVAVVK